MNYQNNSSLYDLAPLLELEIARYTLSCTVCAKEVETYELTALIRSRMGAILKDSFCEFQNFQVRSCNSCNLAQNCLYIRLFAPTCEVVAKAFQGKGRSHTSPARPYNLAARINGDKAEVVLTLFGSEAVEHYQSMTASMTEAALSLDTVHTVQPDCAQKGARKRLLDNLSWYSPVPLIKNGEYCFEKIDKESLMQEEPLSFPLFAWISALQNPCKIIEDSATLLELNFPVPFQLDRMRGAFKFTAFLQAIISRLRDLKRVYHPGNDMGNFSRKFYTKADTVTVVADLERCEYSRYSQHRKKQIFLGGFTGTVILKGDIAPFIPVLAAGFYIGTGKKTVYGLGHFATAAWSGLNGPA